MNQEFLLKNGAKIVYFEAGKVFNIWLTEPFQDRTNIGYALQDNEEFSLEFAKDLLISDLDCSENEGSEEYDFLQHCLSLFP